MAGHARRTVRKFRIVNAAKLPDHLKKPDEVKIGGMVRSLGIASAIHGVLEVWEESC